MFNRKLKKRIEALEKLILVNLEKPRLELLYEEAIEKVISFDLKAQEGGVSAEANVLALKEARRLRASIYNKLQEIQSRTEGYPLTYSEPYEVYK